MAQHYIVIYDSILKDKRLAPIQKLLFGELLSLSNANGFANPSNQWLADKYGSSLRTIENGIARLEATGYIKRKTEQIGMKKQRKIYITENIDITQPKLNVVRNHQNVEQEPHLNVVGNHQNEGNNNQAINNQINNQYASDITANNSYSDLSQYWQSQAGFISPMDTQKMFGDYRDLVEEGASPDDATGIIKHAIDRVAESTDIKRPFAFYSKLMRDWREKQLLTLSAVLADTQAFKQTQQNRSNERSYGRQKKQEAVPAYMQGIQNQNGGS